MTDSADVDHWSRSLGIPFYEAAVERNGHNLSLLFADLLVDVVGEGHPPFVVSAEGPDFKAPSP